MLNGLQWRKWWGWSAPLVILTGGALVFALLVATRPEAVERSPVESHWVVTTQAADPGLHAPLVKVFGYVESPSTVTVKSAVEADVLEVAVRDGQHVARGEMLVKLDDRELRDVLRQRQAELDELEAELRKQRREVEADRADLAAERRLLEIDERRVSRLQRLLEDEAASPADLDDAKEALQRQRQAVIRARQAVDNAQAQIEAAEARRDSAQAARDKARRDVARTTIKAPFEGRISQVEVAAGGRVSPGAKLVELYDTSDLEVRARIPSSRLGGVQRALAGGVEVSGRALIDGQLKPARLDRFAGHSPRDQGGVEAIFALKGRHADVALDRFASIEMELAPEPQSMVLPYEALYGMERVFVVGADNRLREIDVQRLGEARLSNGQRGALVRAPELESGARIVTTQIPQASDGLRVRVQEGR